ncbi:hypothetical protein LSAT2_032711 [Lamellibrachia satsuma]|nr:hypothetical protein LSAT2_032711 [Lamellibrachia satsuma]
MAAHARKMGNPTNVLAPPVSPEVTVEILSGARKAHASMAGVAHILAQHRDASAKLVTLEQPVTVDLGGLFTVEEIVVTRRSCKKKCGNSLNGLQIIISKRAEGSDPKYCAKSFITARKDDMSRYYYHSYGKYLHCVKWRCTVLPLQVAKQTLIVTLTERVTRYMVNVFALMDTLEKLAKCQASKVERSFVPPGLKGGAVLCPTRPQMWSGTLSHQASKVERSFVPPGLKGGAVLCPTRPQMWSGTLSHQASKVERSLSHQASKVERSFVPPGLKAGAVLCPTRTQRNVNRQRRDSTFFTKMFQYLSRDDGHHLRSAGPSSRLQSPSRDDRVVDLIRSACGSADWAASSVLKAHPLSHASTWLPCVAKVV